MNINIFCIFNQNYKITAVISLINYKKLLLIKNLNKQKNLY